MRNERSLHSHVRVAHPYAQRIKIGSDMCNVPEPTVRSEDASQSDRFSMQVLSINFALAGIGFGIANVLYSAVFSPGNLIIAVPILIMAVMALVFQHYLFDVPRTVDRWLEGMKRPSGRDASEVATATDKPTTTISLELAKRLSATRQRLKDQPHLVDDAGLPFTGVLERRLNRLEDEYRAACPLTRKDKEAAWLLMARALDALDMRISQAASGAQRFGSLEEYVSHLENDVAERNGPLSL